MTLVVDDGLSPSSVMGVGVVSVVCVVHSCGLNLSGCLDCTGIGVAAPKTGHEGRLCGSGLDDSVVAAGIHVEGFSWRCFWVWVGICSCV
jgi:hypothetical protein